MKTLFLCAETKLKFILYIREDFSKMLADAWTLTEDQIEIQICHFTATWLVQAADPMYLMSEEEREVYNSFENAAAVYSGVAVGRNPMGLLWTDN